MTTNSEGHLDILAVLARYATALDQRDWPLLDQVFTEDVVFDSGEWVMRSRAEAVAAIRPYLDGCGPTQHLLGNYRIQLAGGRARSQVYVRAFHVGTAELSSTLYEMFGEYSDELVRTQAGWRIAHRRVRLLYELGTRDVLRPGP